MKYLVFDIEGTKLPKSDPWIRGSYICSIGVKRHDGTRKEFLFNHVKEKCDDHNEILKEVQAMIDDSDIIVAHNAKFDINWFRFIGLNVDKVDVWCTMVAEYLLYGQNKAVGLSLNALAARRKLGQKVDKMAEYWDAGYETDEIPWESVHRVYLQQDVELTEQIFKQQFEEVKKAGLLKLTYLCCKVSKVLSRMELNGLDFNIVKAEELYKEYSDKVIQWELDLKRLAGIDFNVSSPDQLRSVLYGGAIKREVQELVAKQRKDGTFRTYTRKAVHEIKIKGLGFRPGDNFKSKKTGQYSTGKNALKSLRWETPEQQQYLEIEKDRKNAAKFCSTLHSKEGAADTGLVSKALNSKDGKLHPTFNQCTTATGRLSSTNPNGQNFPRAGTSPIKSLIYSPTGYIVNSDLSQIEWRMAGSLSDDEVMIQEVQQGVDVHSTRAVKSFGVKPKTEEDPKKFKLARDASKTFNFRMIYNGSAMSFYNDPNMPRFTLEEYKNIVEDFWKTYKGLRAWQYVNKELVEARGFLQNPSGRYLTFRYEDGSDDVYHVGYNFNAICNYPIQSASGDVMFLCLAYIDDQLLKRNMKTKLLLQVHDAVVADCPKNEVYEFGKLCLEAFTNIPKFTKEYFDWEISVPLTGEVSIGKDYGSSLHKDDLNPETFTKERIKELTSL